MRLLAAAPCPLPRWAVIATALLATACTTGGNPADTTGRAPASQPANATGTTVGGDGSAIELLPLTDSDVEAASLAGELACSFSVDSGGALLLAKGNVASDDASRGVVNVAGYVEPVAAPGGFGAMLRGTRFSGAGKVILVELTGPTIGGGESPPNPATLTYQRADGAERMFAGQWQCGP
ncbi:hypothetical protein LY625_09805 [Lysobacter sp. GX 14042]|uniref:hypothetical protein n=1 Tax=Lysobacter sp. GX 14042 TaxID=2907155 RepID=UPI001F15A682|nr:hypothetical protein [Lysobacter sp. GX 14042]MCE7032902.1 hypothetical protein [Lysobacter sp. GX 14042]